MVEWKISEMGHEPYNVQIVFEEYSSDTSFQLYDKDGEFLTVLSADADHSYEVMNHTKRQPVNRLEKNETK